jgi:hypothetical protein
MSYIETLDRKYRSTTPLDLPQIMTGWQWVEWIIDENQVRGSMTPRETFDHWVKEGRLERFSS